MIWTGEILLIGAAFFKAVADNVDHHFDTSIFKKLNPKFWDRDISSETARRVFSYKIDAWHISQSLMLIFLIAGAIFHERKLENPWLEITAGGILWNIVFNLFYNAMYKKVIK